MTTSLTIAQASEATGLSVHTLRYYERIGLLDPVERRDNRHRRYTQEDLNWIAFLKKLKATGLPVRAMLRYAELRRIGNTVESVSQRRAMLQAHTLCVQDTLAELQENLAVLQHKLALYDELEQQVRAALPASAGDKAAAPQPERMTP
ncbi:MerR family transcription regulator protein [Herbaspirillum sp. GW103]|uniref:MerR family transcriptional regulator n=1 Tax=Herbaspirillum sp. GW103 TaxID=1175306 RepID=UPI00025E4A3B|nr:MerR family transcriptional regulator [Herbaspirillum sp. GW103]EIJ45735.1 MerR family transcription regulator protein [Herbaspirillum sp. GW103]